jgi:hypothetical protein
LYSHRRKIIIIYFLFYVDPQKCTNPGEIAPFKRGSDRGRTYHVASRSQRNVLNDPLTFFVHRHSYPGIPKAAGRVRPSPSGQHVRIGQCVVVERHGAATRIGSFQHPRRRLQQAFTFYRTTRRRTTTWSYTPVAPVFYIRAHLLRVHVPNTPYMVTGCERTAVSFKSYATTNIL